MLYIQYAIIALIFILAVAFMVKKFIPTKGKNGGCNKGCGCSFSEKTEY